MQAPRQSLKVFTRINLASNHAVFSANLLKSMLYLLQNYLNSAKTLAFIVRSHTQGDIKVMDELLSWCNEVLRYFNLKRVSVGLNEEEQRLLTGLQQAVDRVTR